MAVEVHEETSNCLAPGYREVRRLSSQNGEAGEAVLAAVKHVATWSLVVAWVDAGGQVPGPI